MDWPEKLARFHDAELRWSELGRRIKYRSPGSIARDIQRRLIRADELWRIAQLLEISVDWLLDPDTRWPPKPESQISARIAVIRQQDAEEQRRLNAGVAAMKKAARKRPRSRGARTRAAHKGA